MKWPWPWEHETLRELPDVTALQGTALDEEKTRTEIEKTRVEILDERSWRTKLILSLIIPVGGALAFVNTWVNDHATARIKSQTQTFSEAAKKLSSLSTPPVRLEAVQTLTGFVLDQSWLERYRHRCEPSNDVESKQSVALIMGDLTTEKDETVLRAISAAAVAKPCQYLPQLISVDRAAAVTFSRSAGDFAGLAELYLHHSNTLDLKADNDADFKQWIQEMLDVIDAITLRGGSPFEAENSLNNQFAARRFFSHGCPYIRLLDRQMRLTVSSGIAVPLRSDPPLVKNLSQAAAQMQADAVVLEKASSILAKIVSRDGGLERLKEASSGHDLFGVAIVIGEIKDKDTVSALKKSGAYVQKYGEDGVCIPPPEEQLSSTP